MHLLAPLSPVWQQFGIPQKTWTGTSPRLVQLDLWNGVPVHAWVVHASLVVIPLSALGLILIVAIPKLRRVLGWLVMLGLIVGLVGAYFARESGAALAARLGRPDQHADLGEYLFWLAIANLVVGLSWYVVAGARARSRRRAAEAGPSAATQAPGGIVLDPVTGMPVDPDTEPASGGGGGSLFAVLLSVLAVALSVATLVLSYQVAQTGLVSTWDSRLAGDQVTPPPTPTPTALPSPSATPSASASPTAGLSTPPTASAAGSASGSAAGSESLPSAPGSPTPGGSATASGLPGRTAIPSASGRTPVPAVAYSMSEVGAHNRAESCWVVISGQVYDLTGWIPRNPEVEQEVTQLCGTDATVVVADGQTPLVASELRRLQIGVIATSQG